MNKKQEELKFWNIFLNKLHRAMAILSVGLMLFILIDTNIRLAVGFGCMCLIVGFILSLYYASKDYAVIKVRKNNYNKGLRTKRYRMKINKEKKIFSLSIGKELSGGFILGCGSIGTEIYYYFYVKKQGGLQLSKVSADEVILRETNIGEPCIQYIEYKEEKEWTIDNKGEFDEEINSILIVPMNTVKQEFTANILN